MTNCLRILPSLLLLFCCLAACPAQAAILLQDELSVQLRETAAAALSDWCRPGNHPAPLLLFSQNPFLQPLPASRVEAAHKLLKECRTGQLEKALSELNPDPLFLPEMSLSAALGAGLFSELIWALPLDETQQLSLPTLKRQLQETGIATGSEAGSFIRNGEALSGTLRGVPVRVIPFYRLPRIKQPVHLLIDLSFFPPLYKGEIKTPLYPLIFETLQRLRGLQLQVISVQLTASNSDGSLPLATRFVGRVLEKLFNAPRLLDGEIPADWLKHGNALYLENFFENEKILAIYREMEARQPDDPAVKYAIYQTLRSQQQGTRALAKLAAAVRLDPLYAFEYLQLAQTALEKKLPEQSLRMIDLALAAWPEHPFIRLRKAELLVNLGKQQEATALLLDLQQLPWSSRYYSRIPQHIDRLLETVQSKPHPASD